MGQHIKQSEKRLADLEAKQQELLEKINCTSKNSSIPPSSDPLHAEKKPEKKKSGKKRGGQPGHKGHSRFLIVLGTLKARIHQNIRASRSFS
nr:DUF6444 domain-containing protein [Mastigocladopsis repens]